MIEIKGKIWHKKEKTFNDNIFTLHDCWNLDKDNDVFLQYTGLHDKNGKEIYEGDIVRISEDELRRVIFVDAGFALQTITKKEFNGGYPSKYLHKQLNMYMETPTTSFVEIIGNIYENPNLINQHK